MNKNKFGLIFGSFFAFFHLIWVILVALGLGQLLLDFILNIHMIYNPFLVTPFSLGRSIALIIVTFLVGYVLGYILAFIWNKFHKIGQNENKSSQSILDNQNNPS